MQEKEHEIERICNENYEDFASAVGMLLSLREGTGHLKGQITQLDEQIGQVGSELSNKVRQGVSEDRCQLTVFFTETCLVEAQEGCTEY